MSAGIIPPGVYWGLSALHCAFLVGRDGYYYNRRLCGLGNTPHKARETDSIVADACIGVAISVLRSVVWPISAVFELGRLAHTLKRP